MPRLVEQKKEEVLEAKRTRVPIHASRGILDLGGLDHLNFQYRWVNRDLPMALDRFLAAGYEFCDSKGKAIVGDKTVDSTAGIGSACTRTGKDGVTLVLMAIPMELFIEDQKAKEAAIRATEHRQGQELRELSNPAKGNYGHVGEFGLTTEAPGLPRPMVPQIRKI